MTYIAMLVLCLFWLQTRVALITKVLFFFYLCFTDGVAIWSWFTYKGYDGQSHMGHNTSAECWWIRI